MSNTPIKRLGYTSLTSKTLPDLHVVGKSPSLPEIKGRSISPHSPKTTMDKSHSQISIKKQDPPAVSTQNITFNGLLRKTDAEKLIEELFGLNYKP